ncbi:MAG: hypothetical protein ACYCYM_07275 [Saccharofermentanales bacterium]
MKKFYMTTATLIITASLMVALVNTGCNYSAGNSHSTIKKLVAATYNFSSKQSVPTTSDIEVSGVDLGEADKRTLVVRREAAGKIEPVKTGVYLDIVNEDVSGMLESVVRKMVDGKLAWTYRHGAEFFAAGYLSMPGGFYIYGTEYATPGDVSVTYGKLILLDNNGSLKWEIDDSSRNIDFHTAIMAEDGIVIFGRRVDNRSSDNEIYMMIQKYDKNGKLVLTNELSMPSYYRASGAAFFDGKYYVNYSGQGGGILASVLENGEFMEQYIFTIDEKEYFIQDVKAFNGKLYLSCISYNTSETQFGQTMNELLTEYYNKCQENSGAISGIEMPADYGERLSSLFRDHYGAALLICGPDAVVQKVLRIDQTKPGALSVEGDTILWQTFRVDVAENALPILSSRRVEIAATEFSLEFDESGKYLGKSAKGFEEIWY